MYGKVFIKGQPQVTTYDECYKVLSTYIRSKYDHRVYMIKIIERIYYNYQSHECIHLNVWD